jgi:hypothetical protein
LDRGGEVHARPLARLLPRFKPRAPAQPGTCG